MVSRVIPVEPFDLVAGIGESLGAGHGEGFVEVGQMPSTG